MDNPKPSVVARLKNIHYRRKSDYSHAEFGTNNRHIEFSIHQQVTARKP